MKKLKTDKLILGIDPGKKGCLSFLNQEGDFCHKEYVPTKIYNKKVIVDLQGIDTIIKRYLKKISYAVLEKVHSMPNQGVTSMFSFGQTFGALEMCLVSNGVKYSLATPQAWQKEIFKKVEGINSKEKSINKARELWPYLNFKRTERCKTDDNNFTDSLLIAKYAIIQSKGEKQ